MNRKPHLILVALLAAALVGVALLAVPASPFHKETTLGLDLQGGLEVTLQAVPPPGRALTKEDLDRSLAIMRDRVDRLGVAEPELRTQGDNQIVIDLPGIKNPGDAAKIIGKTAKLELFDLEADLTGPSIDAQGFRRASDSLFSVLAGQQSKLEGKATSWYLFDKQKKLAVGPKVERAAALSKRGGKVPDG